VTQVALADLLAVRKVETVPRLAFTCDEAAQSLGVSRDFFDQWVLAELRLVRRGRKRLIPAKELERWLEDNAERALP
jgi:excisionase family DNA binding protein